MQQAKISQRGPNTLFSFPEIKLPTVTITVKGKKAIPESKGDHPRICWKYILNRKNNP